ncbi:hypothetical protein EW146_g8614 [Bondarzewia mesenterica]|uniref:DUF300-domain-containing protein n=1 Tax=Bondarzewia mesenterica TaxID=1095465 RepID=A0A4S4LD98_9AGAM|nr:hypothetical protein EW146_g8614 [Bondarzewia mesenterica]
MSSYEKAPDVGRGSGSALSPTLLIVSGLATLIATLVSAMSIFLHLKNYRKPILQRMVIRIMIMVPLYGISSLISLFSLEAAFVIDVVRDIYEAFVIYCFFQLLLAYLGGERSLLILVHGRPPKIPPFPMNIFQRELDVSDPYTFLFLKRGILQYVQVKPLLAVATLILKAVGKFNEGDLRADSGYLYISIIYNASICLTFPPCAKVSCVKGILFFSFWQSIGISILVSAGAIKRLGPYIDKEHISLGLTDTLICLEMPLFAIAHMYAFAYTDYIDKHVAFVGRMPVFYAARDAFGLKDVVEDSKATLRGKGMDYREFEPSEGYMHQGLGRERRIRAGLRYSKGGKGKYWLPRPATSPQGWVGRGVDNAIQRVSGRDQDEEVYAPLLSDDVEDIVHDALDLRDDEGNAADGLELPFGDLDDEDERLFEGSKQYLFGDYHYPCIDASSESARTQMWDEEERILRDERSAWFSSFGERRRVDIGKQGQKYGAVGSSRRAIPRFDNDSTASDQKRSSGSWEAHDQVERSIVDMGAERLPKDDPADVRLKWTKVQGKSVLSSSTSGSPKDASHPNSFSRHNSSSRPPSGSSSPDVNSRAFARTPGESRRSDAVDLVVEDKGAAQADMERERRHGEPAVRGFGMRKVYRRKYLHGEDTAEGLMLIPPESNVIPFADKGERLLALRRTVVMTEVDQ